MTPTSEPSATPLAPRVDGRDPATGRFVAGNRLGRGSPLAGEVAKLRATLLHSIKVGDMRSIIAAMVAKAREGDVAAAKLVLQYSVGEPQPFDFVERLESLEQTFLENQK